jgi:NifU-like protein involved in Fe-S cluster formation
MVGERLRAVMLQADGAGELAGDGVRAGRAEHPVCGDRVELTVRASGRRIDDLRWRASGCPACMAVAATARGALVGRDAAEAAAALRRRLAELGDLAAHERHAEALLLRALAAALPGAG